MRFLLKASFDIEAGNSHAIEGTLGETIHAILDDLKPEAAYFVAEDGRRAALLVVEIDDLSQLPALAEPWFIAFNARLEIQPAMVFEDLAKAAPSIDRAVKKYV